jgi:hypothetical protein
MVQVKNYFEVCLDLEKTPKQELNLALFADFEIGTILPYVPGTYKLFRAQKEEHDAYICMPFPFSRFIAARTIHIHTVGCNFNLKGHLRLNNMYKVLFRETYTTNDLRFGSHSFAFHILGSLRM